MHAQPVPARGGSREAITRGTKLKAMHKRKPLGQEPPEAQTNHAAPTHGQQYVVLVTLGWFLCDHALNVLCTPTPKGVAVRPPLFLPVDSEGSSKARGHFHFTKPVG